MSLLMDVCWIPTTSKYKGKEITPYESFYWNTSPEFFRGQLGGGIARCVKCDDSLATLVMRDPRVMQIGNILDDTDRTFSNPQTGRVYSPEGLSPTINTCQGGGREPKIVEMEEQIQTVCQLSSSQNSRVINPEGISYAMANGEKDGMPKIIEPMIGAMRGRNPDNPSERGRSNGKYKQRLEMNENGTSNTITSVQKDNLVVEPQVLTPKRTEFGKQIRKQYEKGEIQMSRHEMTELEPRTDGVSNTLTSVQKDNLVVEPCQTILNFKNFISLGEQNNSYNRVWKTDNYCGPLNCTKQMEILEEQTEVKYRIRKLTPRECFRLMDVQEADIDKIQEAGISNSQQYKMAGNSIVVSCLYHLFRKMFIETGNEDKQLTFF